MTREEIQQEILALKGSNWLLELATGTGKSKLAIEKIKSLKSKKLLLVVNRIVHKQNWEEEFNKWWPNHGLNITMTTYVSLPKYADTYDVAIFDECHHLSERCREALCNFDIKHSILLSATVNNNLKDSFIEIFDDLVAYKKDLRDIIDKGILPDPVVYLIPLNLSTTAATECIFKNNKAKGVTIDVSYANRWQYLKDRTHPIRIYCSEKQYNEDMDNQIDYWRKRFMRTKSDIAKNKWLRLCSDRLKWLSNKKTPFIQDMISMFANNRTLIFCNSIEQTEDLGKYCINSKNKESKDYITLFNEGKINHITACNILNEGMNLTDCQIGIYANLNNSDIIIKQRMGRILRHKNPILIVPYFTHTRDEELIQKMLENYNSSLVHTVTDIKDIQI